VNKLNILRQVTKPKTEAEVMEIVRSRYDNVRENASTDDQVSGKVAAELTRRKNKTEEWSQRNTS
jgi:hypothetical protein